MTAPDARFRPSVSMLGWALNEEENLRDYLDRAEAFLSAVSSDFELVLIDDGSTDSTWRVAEELQRSRPWLRLLKNDRNRGSGYCYRRAIVAASKDYFLAQTVDWAYDIEAFIPVFPLLREFDVLQGVRAGSWSRDGLRRRSDTLFKAFVSAVNYALVRLLFGAPFTDYQNVTVCPTRLARNVELEADSSFANPEVLLKVWWQGASFKEVAVGFLPRTRGRGTGTRWRSIARSVIEIFRYWIRWVVIGKRSHRTPGRVVRVA